MAQVNPKSFRELHDQGVQPGGIGKTSKPTFPSGGESNSSEESPVVQSKSKGPGELVFPGDLDSIDHFMSFDVFKHTFRRKTEPTKDEIMCSIKLPLAQGLSQENKQNYTSEGIGALGMVGAALGGGLATAIRSGDTAGSVINQITNMSKSDLTQAGSLAGSLALEALAGESGAGAVVGAVTFGLPGLVAGTVGAPIFKGGLAAAGVSRNPYQSTFYSTPEFRAFSYEWKLYPRDEKEQNTLHDIIQNFRYYSAPGGGNDSVFFEYPQQFDITFSHPEYTFNPGPCVLTTVSTDYHPDGPIYHKLSDGSKAPVAVSLKLDFQETFVLTKADIKAGR